MMKMKKKGFVFFFVFTIYTFLNGCQSHYKDEELASQQKDKLLVVTTLFPLYDFAKNITQDKAKVILLLPPGVEAHSFEPKPDDMMKIAKANVFIYTGASMEPWVEKLLKGLDNNKLVIVDASSGVRFLEESFGHDKHHHHQHSDENLKDPHIWLDFDNVQKMIDNILLGIVKADEKNKEFYIKNAEVYKKRVMELDDKYKLGLKDCKNRNMFHAGHYAFGYLARRYNIRYVSAYQGFSADEEPKPADVAKMIEDIKKVKADFVFYEEFLSPKVAEVIAKEAGVKLLKISSGHNLTKEQMNNNLSFIQLMEENLHQLKKGLQCQ